MATYNKFEQFVEDLAKGVHQLHAAGHLLKVYASNAAPSASLDAVKADLAEITAANGYPSGGSDVQNDVSRTGGTLSLTGVDVIWTASGGSFGPLQYVALYNDTPAGPVDPLISWWDYGSAITVLTGETLTIDFSTNIFTLT